MDLSKCQIFTPPHIVKYMLDKIDYTSKIFNKKIIDNACGTGNILVEVVERFIADAKKSKKTNAVIKKGLESCIYGYDIDSKMVEACINNLNEVAGRFKIRDVKWNIYNQDGLYIEDSFDYVVGNPPYISYLDLEKDTRAKTKEKFSSCSVGKFDYSYAFIEKGLQILKLNGKMAMISPANMFKTVFADKLREIIKQELTHIVDCSTIKIFAGVLTTSAITIYEKGCKSNVLVYQEFADAEKKEQIIKKDTLVGKWNFTNYIESGNRRFGDYFKASNCIATLANKVFIHKIDEQGNLAIDVEPEAVKVAISPKSEQFGIKQKIIFPYYYENGKLKNYTEKEINLKFPKLMKYLTSKRVELISRDSDKSAKWYEYGRSQALSSMNQEKLLISTIITKVVKLYKLDNNTIPYSGIYIVPRGNASLDDAKLILQTERFYNYLHTKGVNVSGESIRISSRDVEEYRY
ncbi:MAG: SAM-dependent methyltransferase [Ruminococcaceae bacterium]|nr:SAM-dependent methyltransferase [Oscillospiraceae bacterium]